VLDDWRTQLGGAALLLALALLGSVRRRLRRGKRVFPRVHVRTYFSIRSPESDPPTEQLEAGDVEIIEPGHPLDELGDFDVRPTDRPTPDLKKRRNRRP
jgi:hypothetical protein